MRRSSNRFLTTFFALAIPALGAAGCNSDTTTPTTTTTTAPATQVTEAFSGSLNINGAVTFNFAATAAGSVNANIKSVSPATTAILGLALGTWNGVACQVVIANDAASAGVTVTGTNSAAGNLCVRVYDVGKLTAAQSIEVTITHY